jgi:hypothetical protein
VTKCLSGSAFRDSLGGDFYEGSKFALRGAEVTLSNSLARSVGGRRIVARTMPEAARRAVMRDLRMTLVGARIEVQRSEREAVLA